MSLEYRAESPKASPDRIIDGTVRAARTKIWRTLRQVVPRGRMACFRFFSAHKTCQPPGNQRGGIFPAYSKLFILTPQFGFQDCFSGQGREYLFQEWLAFLQNQDALAGRQKGKKHFFGQRPGHAQFQNRNPAVVLQGISQIVPGNARGNDAISGMHIRAADSVERAFFPQFPWQEPSARPVFCAALLPQPEQAQNGRDCVQTPGFRAPPDRKFAQPCPANGLYGLWCAASRAVRVSWPCQMRPASFRRLPGLWPVPGRADAQGAHSPCCPVRSGWNGSRDRQRSGTTRPPGKTDVRGREQWIGSHVEAHMLHCRQAFHACQGSAGGNFHGRLFIDRILKEKSVPDLSLALIKAKVSATSEDGVPG